MKIAIVVNSAWAAYNFRMNLAKNILNEGNEVICLDNFFTGRKKNISHLMTII